MKHLIIPSNLNLNSFENTIVAYHNAYNEFDSLLVLETDESTNKDITSRNMIIKSIFGYEIEIREKNISNNSNFKITHVINNSLKQYNRENIIVDLTNGTKEISSLLYMAASLSRIKNINYISVAKDKSGRFYSLKNIDNNKMSQYYDIKYFEPLQELDSLAKWNFFDLLFYKEKIEKIFDDYPEQIQAITDDWKVQFNNALDHYFNGDKTFDSALRTFGVLIEDVSNKLFQVISKDEKYANKSFTYVINDYFNNIRTNHKNKQTFNDFRDINFSTDKFLDIVRLYRNQSAHSIKIKFKEEDIQTIIMILITFFINIKEFFKNESK